MEIVDLLATFSDPSTIKSLTASQRLMAGLVTTLLGMGITFVALVVLLFITSLFDKLSALEKTQSESPQRTAPTAKKKDIKPEPKSDEELVAAITAAIAITLNTPANDIIVRNIRKIEDSTPAWSKAGIAEQMQNKV
jgi:sodium pump decarboxylase gamma subunit